MFQLKHKHKTQSPPTSSIDSLARVCARNKDGLNGKLAIVRCMCERRGRGMEKMGKHPPIAENIPRDKFVEGSGKCKAINIWMAIIC